MGLNPKGQTTFETASMLLLTASILFGAHLSVLRNWRRLIGGTEGDLTFEEFRQLFGSDVARKRVLGLQNLRTPYDGKKIYEGRPCENSTVPQGTMGE